MLFAKKKKRTFVLGIDGVPYSFLQDNFAKGKMPINIIEDHIGPIMRLYWKMTEWLYKPLLGFKKPYFQNIAKELKKRGLTIPLLVSGGVRRYSDAENILDEGAADLIGMGCPLFKEPSLPNKWMKSEKVESTCISCNKCTFEVGVNGNPLKCHYSMQLMILWAKQIIY